MSNQDDELSNALDEIEALKEKMKDLENQQAEDKKKMEQLEIERTIADMNEERIRRGDYKPTNGEKP